MALMPMQKIAVFFPRSERDRLLSLLQDKGSVEILDLKETPLAEEVETTEVAGGGDADRIAGDIRRAIDDVSEFEEKAGFLSGLAGGKLVVSEHDFANIAGDFDYGAIIEAVGDLEARRTELRTKRTHLEAFIERLRPWMDLDMPLEEIAPRKDARILAGVISGTVTPEMLIAALAEVGETAEIEVVSQTKRDSHIVVFYHKTEEEKIQEVLRGNDFEIHTFEGLKGLPRDLASDASSKISAIDTELAGLAKKGSELARHKPHLMIACDYFAQEAGKASAQGLIGTTEHVGLVQGWIRAHEYERLSHDLEAGLEVAEVLKIEPDEGEEPPIELKNKRVLKPFEVLTEMYGMPRSHEIDPTPLAGPFFALFFGFCITDAGYGIVLCALSLLLMKYLKVGRKILWLGFAGGLTTILMGAITGGWFGLNDQTIPGWLSFVAAFRNKLMQFDPLEDPMTMFGLALALGIIQVSFGVVVKMIEDFRHRDIAAGIFDQLTWVLLLWSAVLFGLVRMGVLSAAYAPTIKWVAIGAAVGLIGFTNRASKNPAVRAGSGLYRLYQIATSSLGDVLSYTRLLALGMATGGIAMVINVVALIAKDIPVIGIPAMIFVLAAGHSFNIAVNALGGFVHSARLQYVEFYPKFFEGGGRAFRPFRKELQYTRLIEDKAS
jgi:V/A-type H+-transporting ATPase subunit I